MEMTRYPERLSGYRPCPTCRRRGRAVGLRLGAGTRTTTYRCNHGHTWQQSSEEHWPSVPS